MEFIDPNGSTVAIKGIFPTRLKYAKAGIKISKFLESKISQCNADAEFILIYKYLGQINGIDYFYSESLDGDLVDFLNRLNTITYKKRIKRNNYKTIN